MCEFKNKTLGLPYGEKVERIEIPKAIPDMKNKEIYRACIRGIFNTDGFVHIVKKGYQIISITIKSRKLIGQLADMLKKIGFIPAVHQWTINLNGPTMVKKWLKEIGSNNSKNINKLERARRIMDSTKPCGGFNLGSTPSVPISP